jgi:hypothetical protein
MLTLNIIAKKKYLIIYRITIIFYLITKKPLKYNKNDNIISIDITTSTPN